MMLTGIRQMEMQTLPMPQITNSTDVLIKMKSVGVCGSDVHYYTTGRIGSQIVKYPFPVGHEGAGEVVEIGSAVTHVKVGDRVAIEPAMSCGHCDQCKAGRENTCRNLIFLGCPGQANGLLTQYIVMPQQCCFVLANNMTYHQAAISEPLAIGVYAVKKSIPMQGATVGILGVGPIGQSVLLPALAQGAAKVFVTDKINQRLALAKQNGAFWTGNPNEVNIVEEVKKLEPLMLDVVFECCGQQEAINQALELLKPGGKLMIVGIPETDKLEFKVDLMRHREITIYNVRRQNHCVQLALDMINNNEINVDNWVTHRFNFTDTQKAFDLVANYNDGVLKAMIDFE